LLDKNTNLRHQTGEWKTTNYRNTSPTYQTQQRDSDNYSFVVMVTDITL